MMDAKRIALSASAGLLGAFIGFYAVGCGQPDDDHDVSFKPAKTADVRKKTETPTKVAKGYGSIVGEITVEGEPPERKVRFDVGKASVNPNVCAADQSIWLQSPVIGENRGLANVFFYLDRSPAGVKETGTASEESAGWASVFDNNNCTFMPHALIVRAGEPLTVTSHDAVNHNVHSYPARNQEVNFTLAKGQRVEIRYKSAERVPVKVVCDIHKWMEAYHLPLDHPYAAVTDELGRFVIKNLPSGRHSFCVWHEQFGLMKEEAVVERDRKTKVEIKILAKKLVR